jgi:hypothetical protein
MKCDPQHTEAHYCLNLLLMDHRQDIDGAERELQAVMKCGSWLVTRSMPMRTVASAPTPHAGQAGHRQYRARVSSGDEVRPAQQP